MKTPAEVVVLGSGIAGLFFALRTAEKHSVCIVTKKTAAESATNWAQGGIAAAIGSDDSFERHARDTIEAGAGLCREDVVRMVVQKGPSSIRSLLDLGVEFDREDLKNESSFELGREGGHRTRRVLHHGDATGREIEGTLLSHARKHPNIQLLENHCAVDLITSAKLGRPGTNRVIGVYVFDRQEDRVEAYGCKAVFLATGGAGKVYQYTSNPDIASGDGMAMAYRAGATLANMEFFQFHPTCLYHPKAKSFLITEAIRGEGGILRNTEGKPFMSGHHELRDLAPRDVVARAIDTELKRTGADHVLLDITHKEATFLKKRFPTIYSRCLNFGIDLTKEPIPVVPAAHYCCGGVVTDKSGETDLPNLFAAGEVTCTGLHGANRLASNSLLEGVVFAEAASDALKKRLPSLSENDTIPIPDWQEGNATDSSEAVVIKQNWDEIREFMWNYVGIVRSDKRIDRAKRRIELLRDEITEYYWNFRLTTDLIELRNLSCIAHLVIECASQRKESRGLHYNIDFPNAKQSHRVDTVIKLKT